MGGGRADVPQRSEEAEMSQLVLLPMLGGGDQAAARLFF